MSVLPGTKQRRTFMFDAPKWSGKIFFEQRDVYGEETHLDAVGMVHVKRSSCYHTQRCAYPNTQNINNQQDTWVVTALPTGKTSYMNFKVSTHHHPFNVGG